VKKSREVTLYNKKNCSLKKAVSTDQYNNNLNLQKGNLSGKSKF
jgi:hypothetical protein